MSKSVPCSLLVAKAYEKRIRDLEGEVSKSKVTEARTEDDFAKLRAELETLADTVVRWHARCTCG